MAELQTFVFTDIAGSVRVKDEMPGHSAIERDQAFVETILRPHRERIERELAAHAGRVVSTAGDGHFLVFSDAIRAARWTVSVQQSHRDEPLSSPQGTTIHCRISMHVGIPQVDPSDPHNFIGKAVDYAARLNDYATSGQILVSRSVVAILEDVGMDGIRFHLHGRKDLKGIGRVEVHELVYEESGPRRTRNSPKGKDQRQWTVLPSGWQQTEFFAGDSHSSPGSTTTVRKLGNYELSERLGSGGMGDVYKARHTLFGRTRAVKVIKQHYVDAGHEEVIRRFYREIRAVGRLDHPNVVVAIESSAPTDAVHFLVMEYIDGFSVEDLVHEVGALSIADACEIGRQAAVGLEYIHQNQMVHRDIKPSNLMLARSPAEVNLGSGEGGSQSGSQAEDRVLVKILDLGLALLAVEEGERFTRFEQRAMGTGMYMAPEQWRTTSVDIRADLYSLGCTLYHLLAGKPPFADSDLRPQRAHELSKLPKISRPNDAVPRQLWNVVRKMTAKRPEDRYQAPHEVAAALEPFCQSQDLAGLIRHHKKSITGRPTALDGNSDTHISDGVRRDTQHGSRPRYATPPAAAPSQGRSSRWQFAAIAAALVLVAALSWVIATGRIDRGAGDRWQQNLLLTADYAARDIETEIANRINILNQAASAAALPRMIARYEAARTSGNNALQGDTHQNLNNWVLARKDASREDFPSESWFLVDEDGIQIARSPVSRKSMGESYAHRDYFHGQGRDFEEGSEQAAGAVPLEEPHHSAVYESTATGHLKVAFSAPVWGEQEGSSEQEVVGVLGMSVDLNEFYVLEGKVLEGQQVVLLNLATDFLESETGQRGLILHHPNIQEGQGRRASEELVQLIDEALGEASQGEERAATLPYYRDNAVTGGNEFRGAVMRVTDRKSIANPDVTAWVVLVQEPVE